MIRLFSFLSFYLLVGCGSQIGMENTFIVNTNSLDEESSSSNSSPGLTSSSSIDVIELSSNVISSSQLRVRDSEQGGSKITYEVESLPSLGDLSLNGVPLAVGETFTQDDVDNSLLSYVHKYDLADDNTAGSDSFSFSYTDGIVDKVAGNNITLNIANFCDDKSSATVFSSYGDGSDANPYIICTLAQLNSIGMDNNAWTSSFKLKASIDMSSLTGTSYNIIGTTSRKFRGHFDGRNNTLSNFTYSDASADYVGIFGIVAQPGKTIKSIKMSNVNVTGRDYVGALIGWGYFASFHNLDVQGSINCVNYCGGIAGKIDGSLVSFLAADIDVNASGSGVGGILGFFSYGNIENVFSKGEVDGVDYVGGVIGATSRANAENILNIANVTASSYVGGIVGEFWRTGRLDNAFNAGNISGNSAGNSYVGHIFGRANGLVDNLHYDSNKSCANSGAGGSCNTTGSPNAVNTSSSPSYFYEKLNAPLSSWDFNNSWKENASDYPSLNPAELVSSWGSCSDHLSDLPFAGGIGTALNPYIICSAAQLNQIGLDNSYLDKHFVIKNNIDMSEISGNYNIIGSSANPFKGSLSGHGYSISNLTINEAADDVGLIGYASEGLFQGVRLISVDITGQENTGALIGNSYSPINITLSAVTGNVTGQDYTGGLVGRLSRGAIGSSYSQATINGQNYVGGLAGGTDLGETLIEHSYSSGTITGQSAVGGLIGGVLTGENEFKYVFSASAITGTGTHIGQLHGVDAAFTLVSAYIDEDALCSGCVHTRGTNVDTDSSPNYFFSKTSAVFSVWDFSRIWKENSGSFPTLRH